MMIAPRPLLEDGPDKRDKPRRRRQRLVAFVAVLALASLGLEAWWMLTPAPAVQRASRIVEIPAHSGFLDVARQLDDAEVIQSPLGFVLLTVARGSMRALKAGEYQIP